MRAWRPYEPVTPDWVTDYLRLSYMAHRAGIIDDKMLVERLARVLEADEDDGPMRVNDKPDRFVDGAACRQHSGSSQVAATSSAPSPMEFSLPRQSPQSGWVFSSSDTDPLPSIPHGHWKSHANQRKLDPYLGYIYEGRNPTGERLSWKECNRFWRSKNFRGFAAAALQAAIADPRMSAERHLGARGVERPFKFPR